MKFIANIVNLFGALLSSVGAAETEPIKVIEMEINFERFVDSFCYMGVGMLCIFVVIGVIILTITGLTAAMNALKNRKKK